MSADTTLLVYDALVLLELNVQLFMVVTFGLACWMCIALCLGMIVASVAGIAYGYNYCMAEFLTLTSRSEVTVFMRRGKFYDPPDIKSPLVQASGRRSGNFEEELNANMSSDYDESLRRAREAASKSLGDAWVKSDDTRRYAERLTKFSDNVDSQDVVNVVHVTPGTTMEDSRRANGKDDAAKYSDNLRSYSGQIKGDNDEERSKTTLPSTSTVASTWKFPEILRMGSEDKAAMLMMNGPTSSTTLDARTVGDYMDNRWDFAEKFSKYGSGDKLVMENPPSVRTTSTTTRTTVDDSWQFAEKLSKYVDAKKVHGNVVKVETPAPFTESTTTTRTTTTTVSTRRPGYLNFLKPLRTNSRKTMTSGESDSYTKGRMSLRRTTQNRSDSKIKFVERKHQDNKATLAPMRHWATRATTRASSEEYSSSDEDDEDIVYKSV